MSIPIFDPDNWYDDHYMQEYAEKVYDYLKPEPDTGQPRYLVSKYTEPSPQLGREILTMDFRS